MPVHTASDEPPSANVQYVLLPEVPQWFSAGVSPLLIMEGATGVEGLPRRSPVDEVLAALSGE